MKAILFILFILVSLSAFSQQETNNLKVNGTLASSGNIRSLTNILTGLRLVSTSQTLLKTDQMILASGDVTLQAPAITAADSGLTITVKNIGTYTDLVIWHIAGTVADSITDARLLRWQARTIVAGKDGKWYTKEKEGRTDYIYDVSISGSFKSIHEVLAFLHEHMAAPSVVRLGGGVYTINHTETINLPYALDFRGFSYITTLIQAATGLANTPMFRCLSDVSFEALRIDGTTLAGYGANPGEDCIRYVGTKTYNELRNFAITGFYDAIVDSSDNEIWINEGDITGATSSGLKITGSEDSVRVRMIATDFINCDKGIWLLKGAKSYINIDGGCAFRGGTINDTGIVYVPSTFTNTTAGYITGTEWNLLGTYLGGFDFTRPDGRDAIWFVESNAGLESKTPHAKINVVNNTTATTITTTNTYYRANVNNTVTITFDAAATGGTFTMTIGDQTTGAIAYNANSATMATNIKTAIDALSNVTAVTVTSVIAQREFTILYTTAGEGWVKHLATISSLTSVTNYTLKGNTYSCKFKIESNRVTYLAINSRDIFGSISLNLICSNANRNADIALAHYSSGNVLKGYYGLMTGVVVGTTSTTPTSITTNFYVPDAVQGDYIEIHLSKGSNAGETLTLQDLNWYIDSK